MSFQQCPVCNGTGLEEVPYQQGHTVSTAPKQTCTVCKGHKIISAVTGLPPNYAWDTPIENNLRVNETNSDKLNKLNIKDFKPQDLTGKCFLCDEHIPVEQYQRHLKHVHDY